MALNIITPTFGPVVFAKNPVIFQLRSLDGSSEPYAAQGAVATIQAGASAKFATGETMTVTYDEPDGTSEAVVFTAAATYDDEDQIPDSSYSGTIAAYWEVVRAKVAAHHRIAPYITVTRSGPLGGNKLTLKTNDSDAGWSIVIANTAGFTVTDTAPTADTTPANYAVLMEVFVEQTYKGGDYKLAAQLENTPDSDGYTWFDISSVLEAECQNTQTLPAVPQWADNDTMLADNLRRFYIRYTERYGAPATAQEWEYDSVRKCMAGGISQSIWALGDFLAGFDATDALLTWMPDGRKIGLDQPEWLAWYNWDVEPRAVKIQMRWYSIVDNTESATSLHFTALSTGVNEVALLPANPTLLGLDAEADAYKFQVRVVYIDDALSPVALSQWRTYYIDRDYYESQRYVQYLNGFGVPECWRCTGVWGKKLSVQRSVAEKALLPGYNEFATDRYQFGRIFDNELVYRTGFISRGEAEVLQEMLIAGEIYDVSSEGYVPLSITSNAFDVTDTAEDLHSYTFSTQPRLDARNYSKKKLTEMLSGAWQEVGGESWFDAFLVAWELP